MSRYLGEQLRRLRQERGLTQRELAAQVGLSQAQISLHEKGEDIPAPPARARYARSLGITNEQLEGLIDRGRLIDLLHANAVLSEQTKQSIEDYIDFVWERDRQRRAKEEGTRQGRRISSD